MTSLIAYSWYFWVLPSELTVANAGANIGGAFGAVTIAVVAAQMLANNFGWIDLFYVTGGILESFVQTLSLNKKALLLSGNL